MNVYHALKMIQIEHQPLNHRQVVITDENGKPLSQLTNLLSDCPSKIDLFVDLPSTDTASDVSDVIDDLHLLTPLPNDVLDEYQKVLDQPI
ncbi:hypothetical protein [Lactiplantibacillus plantarum]|uniref:hypothetical protein n=1 Tax=Lactiplantibacillus plantarum TaxID=1590 RepID=UPI00280BB62A|nr:hypothetical protein [Lactiplantibacillus plantarum]